MDVRAPHLWGPAGDPSFTTANAWEQVPQSFRSCRNSAALERRRGRNSPTDLEAVSETAQDPSPHGLRLPLLDLFIPIQIVPEPETRGCETPAAGGGLRSTHIPEPLLQPHLDGIRQALRMSLV